MQAVFDSGLFLYTYGRVEDRRKLPTFGVGCQNQRNMILVFGTLKEPSPCTEAVNGWEATEKRANNLGEPMAQLVQNI